MDAAIYTWIKNMCTAFNIRTFDKSHSATVSVTMENPIGTFLEYPRFT